jgi:hypothetical protein
MMATPLGNSPAYFIVADNKALIRLPPSIVLVKYIARQEVETQKWKSQYSCLTS